MENHDLKIKLMRITTIPLSLNKLITGQMLFMKQNGFDVTAISSGGAEIETIKKREQCDFKIVEMTRTISPLKDLKSLIKLVRILNETKPQIVHTHTPKAGLIGMIAAWFCKVPVRMHTIAGLPLMETKGLKKQILILVEKLTYACAHYIYPNSFELRRYILQHHFAPPKKVKVIANGTSNGIDITYFKKTDELSSAGSLLRNQLKISKQDITFIFIGRIVKDKGINELVNAFHHLNKKYSSIKLFLVGPFEDLDPIHEQTKEIIRSNNNIISTGYIDDVRPYLAASNVLAFPSYREGFPNVPLQAGCFELALILSDINGCNEIVTENTNGMLVPSKNTEALKSAMEKMIVDNELRKNLGSNARKSIVEKYSKETVWNALLNEYKILLENKGITFEHVQKSTKAGV